MRSGGTSITNSSGDNLKVVRAAVAVREQA